MKSVGTLYRRLMSLCGILSALIFAAMTILVSWDVVSRNVQFGQLPWIVELTEYAMPAATFLAAPWLLHRAEHVRMELLVTLLPPGGARACGAVADAIGLAISLVFVWYGLAIIADARSIGAQVIKTLVFPEWWLFVPLPAAGALMSLEFIRRLAGGGRRA
ncbi:MAG TPA: TRAP transporter small permease [Alphaproteobacteria bacterium]|nr:TRAP transporter small permease [Alphaproteobacteria bacterium]